MNDTVSFDPRSQLCEVCGALCRYMVQDLRAIEPEADEGGQLWPRYECEGPVHFFCEAHQRDGNVKPLEAK